jgi:RimJ/RimL family protein N-acetyltransferase
MRVRADESREAFHAWFESMLAYALPFATLIEGVPLGHTSYLNVREDDRVAEIGNTWLASRAWGTGANAEAKLLLLEHAFEREGFLRIEFKTDAANERARGALAQFAEFDGVFRKHMLVRGGQRRDSAWYSVIDDDWPAAKAKLRSRLAAEDLGTAGRGE